MSYPEPSPSGPEYYSDTLSVTSGKVKSSGFCARTEVVMKAGKLTSVISVYRHGSMHPNANSFESTLATLA